MRLVFLHMHCTSVIPQPDEEMAEIMIVVPHFGGSAAPAWAETTEAIPAMMAKSENFMMAILDVKW